MDKLHLIEALESYDTIFDVEASFIPRFKSLLANFPNCYNRSLLTGHITASVWIIDDIGSHTLLLKHKKLNRWLQPGGHADGDENVVTVALKEAREETGLNNIKIVGNKLFDMDIHMIPARSNVPDHFHYDLRFLMVADKKERIKLNNESIDFAWISMDKVKDYTANNDSINRMVKKTKMIFN